MGPGGTAAASDGALARDRRAGASSRARCRLSRPGSSRRRVRVRSAGALAGRAVGAQKPGQEHAVPRARARRPRALHAGRRARRARIARGIGEVMEARHTSHFTSLYPERKLKRRGFLVTSLGAGFALAMQPVSSQTIKTDAFGLEAGEVKVPVKDGAIPAYRAMPFRGINFPTVIVVEEVFGVHEHIRDLCRRLAKAG